jgi:hypothetical protein
LYENTIVSVRLSQPTVKVSNTTKGVTISWEKYKGATGYKLYRRLSGQSTWTAIKFVSSGTTTYTDTTALSGKTYDYTIRTFHNKVYSSADLTGVKICRIAPKNISSITSSVKGKIAVKWAKSAGATGYQIQCSSKSDYSTGRSARQTGAGNVTRTISNLKSGATYYVRVRTYKTVGGVTYYGAWGTSKKIKVK